MTRLAPFLPRAASASEAAIQIARALEAADLDAIPDTALERATLLAGLGGAPAEAIAAHPEDLPLLGTPVVPRGNDLEELRASRRRSTLSVAGAELAGALEPRATGRALSEAADVVLHRALDLVREGLPERHRKVELAVLALGKLGGQELNYSSDVDLVLVRADAATEESAAALSRAFIRALEDATAEGRLYRTDLRLRPEGAGGALAPRFTGAVAYYGKSGRTWERQAFIKARAAAGDRELGARFLAAIAPFVWETPLDSKAIEEILSLRARIEAKAAGVLEGEAERNVKEGPGGIRDVEYCVQFLQLLHRDPALRGTGTLDAVDRLEAATIVRAEEARALRESYGFLRRVEHALQLTRDRELKQVPRDTVARERLARALGLGLRGFDEQLAAMRGQARRTLDALLRKPFAASEPVASGEGSFSRRSSSQRLSPPKSSEEEPAKERGRAIRDIVLKNETGPSAHERLASLGFRDAPGALARLDSLASERSALLAPSGRARTLLAGLAPRLLEALGRAPDPDAALRNLERATATLGAKATFYELLLEHADALELFVALAAASDFLVETLARRPGVFDEVIDRLLTGGRPSRAEIEAEASAALSRPGDPGEHLRDVRAVHVLLVGIRDISGRANVQNTGRDLAALAEGMLAAILVKARATVAARTGGEPAGVKLAVLALGKLGAFELSYSSDLDLLFLISGHGATPSGVPAESFFEDVAREALRLGEGSASPEGPLYPIDLRLRPAGARGRLVVTLEAARRYYAGVGPGEHAADWERLALQKVRAAAGDADFPQEAVRVLTDDLYARSYAGLRAAVVDMRAKQVDAASSDDLKRAKGGLSDIEFLASTLALENGGKLPSLREPNTARLLGALKEAGLLGAGDHLELLTAYQYLRRVELRLRVAANRPESRVPRELEERRGLALRLGYVDTGTKTAEAQLDRELGYHRGRARAIFEKLLVEER